ncbi:MAG: hypothetical protein J6W29_00820 [Neisseriaceae bacterium]|nr:hypothetical protein [Neisseriaceae bacterium]
MPTSKPQGLHNARDLINAYRRCGGLKTHPTAVLLIFQAAHFVIASRAVSTAWQSPKIIFK